MRHHKFDEIVTLVNAGMPLLLTGEKGSGKTTLCVQVAEHLEMDFFSMSMTRQTTLSHLLGFMSVNGTYVPSQLRNVAENGGVFLLDEIDAADANVILCLNNIENGYISFPDGIVKLHEDFRLMASSNPQSEEYVGRSRLDAATLDRFDIVDIDRDENLEKSMVDEDVFQHIDALRTVLKEMNSSTVISMRDSLRYQKRKELQLLDGYMFRLTGKSDLVYEKYLVHVSHIPKYTDQAECATLDDLFELMQQERSNRPAEPEEPETKESTGKRKKRPPEQDFPEPTDDDTPS